MPVQAEDVQRLFLQAVMSRRTVSITLAKALWEKSVEAVRAVDNTVNVNYSDSKDAWETFVSDINKRLNRLDIQFLSTFDEITGKEIYALVNQKGDEVAQLGTEYTPAEIAFFKAVVEQIMLAPNEAWSVSSMVALREVAHLKVNMTKSQAENVLGSFVAKAWLMTQKGRYYLSSRCILELTPYLQSNYPNQMNECAICMGLVTIGVGCHTPNCKTRMHTLCFNKHRARYDKCPTCSAGWPKEATGGGLLPIGPDAARGGSAERRMTRRDVGEEDDDEEANATPEASQVPKTERKATKSNGKKRKTKASMDVDDDEEAEETPVESEAEQTDTEANGKPSRKGKGRRR